MKREALHPFGLALTFDEGTRWDDLDPAQIRAWVDEHRVVVLSGLAPMEPEALAAASRRLGPLQPWPFGAVHELKRVADTENYLYTEHEVPLHWDGAFASAVPHFLVFRCVAAPPAEAGGETVFVDTIAALARASPGSGSGGRAPACGTARRRRLTTAASSPPASLLATRPSACR